MHIGEVAMLRAHHNNAYIIMKHPVSFSTPSNLQGLTHIAKTKQASTERDALKLLGSYMLNHNPNKTRTYLPGELPQFSEGTAEGEWALEKAEKKIEVSKRRVLTVGLSPYSDSVSCRITVRHLGLQLTAQQHRVACQINLL